MLSFDLLQTPLQDGDVLIEPPAWQWLSLIERSVTRCKADQANLCLAGRSVREVRQQTRQQLCGANTSGLIIACGHQPAFVHPGVWAKHTAVRHMADHMGVHGVDLVVDNDTPHSTALTVPAVNSEGILMKQHVPIISGTAGSAYEGRPPLSHGAIESFQRATEDSLLLAMGLTKHTASANNKVSLPLVADYCRGLLQVERPTDFVDQHMAGRDSVDRLFDVTLQELRVSEAFDGLFVADILTNLERFTQAYNASLAEYRRDQHIRGVDRPLPDLKTADCRVEAPFWIYQPNQQRSRLWILRRGDSLELFADNRSAATLSREDLLRDPGLALASLSPWSIRPRALTLTLWARLLVCDLFVHGIGGAKYDRVTDGIFRRYYRCEPPVYACVSATLRLPLSRYSVTAADLAASQRRLRDVHFNPHRYVNSPPADLLAERQRLIGESKRLRENRGPASNRRDVFDSIRHVNTRIEGIDPQVVSRIEQDLNRTRIQLHNNDIADSREFFYVLQPRDRLAMLAGRVIEALRSQ